MFYVIDDTLRGGWLYHSPRFDPRLVRPALTVYMIVEGVGGRRGKTENARVYPDTIGCSYSSLS